MPSGSVSPARERVEAAGSTRRGGVRRIGTRVRLCVPTAPDDAGNPRNSNNEPATVIHLSDPHRSSSGRSSIDHVLIIAPPFPIVLLLPPPPSPSPFFLFAYPPLAHIGTVRFLSFLLLEEAVEEK